MHDDTLDVLCKEPHSVLTGFTCLTTSTGFTCLTAFTGFSCLTTSTGFTCLPSLLVLLV